MQTVKLRIKIRIIEIQHNYISWADTGSKHFLPESRERQIEEEPASVASVLFTPLEITQVRHLAYTRTRGMCSFKVLSIWIQWNTLQCLQCSSLANRDEDPTHFFLFIYFNLSIFSVTIVLFRVVSFDIVIIGLKYYTFLKIQRMAVNN